MEKQKFRNHISIIFENMGGMFLAIITLIVLAFWDTLGELIVNGISIIPILIGLGIIIVVAGILAAREYWVWKRTWIVLGNGTISIEKNTITTKKNTLRIKKISNVNVEQNIFEMILGTSKVKINTNSLTTADFTDLRIVLKKDEAEQLKQTLLQQMGLISGKESENNIEEQQNVQNSKVQPYYGKINEKEQLRANNEELNTKEQLSGDDIGRNANQQMSYNKFVQTEQEELNSNTIDEKQQKGQGYELTKRDIVSHSIFTLNIFANLLVGLVYSVAITGMIITFISEIIGEKKVEQYLSNNTTIGIILTIYIILIVGVIIWDLIRQYFKMYGFSAKRDGDKIYIKYGLFKQVDYSIPVKTINAVVVNQTLIARIFKKYSVEIVNVGMGDEKEESTYLCLYGTREKILEEIEQLLPEYSEAIKGKISKQPKSVWIIKTIHIILETVILIAIALSAIWLEAPQRITAIILGILVIINILRHIFNYITAGICMSDNYIGICRGTYTKEYSIIKTEKIQYITINTDLLKNKLGIANGKINVLAMESKNVQIMPYIRKENVEDIIKLIRK